MVRIARSLTGELTVSLERKTIHRVFFKQCQEEEWDTSGSHAWLLDGRVQAQTEALIMAAQDGVILTRPFRSRVMGKAVSPACFVCKGAPETIGHILSSHACTIEVDALQRETDTTEFFYQSIRTLAANYNIV